GSGRRSTSMAQQQQKQPESGGQSRSGESRSVERREHRGREPRLPEGPASPFTFIRRFAEEMDRMFDEVALGGRGPRIEVQGRGARSWLPQLEVFERNGKFVVRADLPGIKREDVGVDIEDDQLTIEGHRHEEEEHGEGDAYRSERQYGVFRRT